MLCLLGLGGCALLERARVTHTPAPAPASATAAPARSSSSAPELPLSRIIGEQLEHGRYAEGEQSLRRYLASHPGNRLAESLLHQLTVDPVRELGPPAQEQQVRPGDSYSTLAARYLGDPRLFLLLARYNDAADPSLLQVGQTVRLPAPLKHGPARPADRVAAAPARAPEAKPAAAVETTAARAKRLEQESLALLRQGRHEQALTRMDEALSADPSLPLQGGDARGLRDQLVGAYHQRAIVLYRDQQLDQAINLWNHVLVISPDYEPALVYRARALELQQRLKQY